MLQNVKNEPFLKTQHGCRLQHHFGKNDKFYLMVTSFQIMTDAN